MRRGGVGFVNSTFSWISCVDWASQNATVATSLRIGISTVQSRPSSRATRGRGCIGPFRIGGRIPDSGRMEIFFVLPEQQVWRHNWWRKSSHSQTKSPSTHESLMATQHKIINQDFRLFSPTNPLLQTTYGNYQEDECNTVSTSVIWLWELFVTNSLMGHIEHPASWPIWYSTPALFRNAWN